MDIKEIEELKNESYDKWFERWYEKSNLESKIKISAQQGYSGLNIAVSKENEEYLRRRLNDPRTIEFLKGKLNGFNIRYIEEEGDTTLLGRKVGSWYRKVINISWKVGE